MSLNRPLPWLIFGMLLMVVLFAGSTFSGTTFIQSGFGLDLADKALCTILTSAGQNVTCSIVDDTFTFVNGTGISITTDFPNKKLFINNTGGGADLTSASNLGSGEGIFAQEVANDLEFKSLTADGTGITLTDNTTDVGIGLDDIVHDSITDCADGEILKWATGGAEWGCAADIGGGAGDDLGDHIADQDLQMQAFDIDFQDAGQIIDSETDGIDIQVPAGDLVEIEIDSTSEYNFNAARADFQGNSLEDLGTPTTATHAQRVDMLQLNNLVTSDCSNGQILEFQISNSTWICGNDDSGSGGITTLNSQTGATQTLTQQTDKILINSATDDHAFTLGTDVVTIDQANTYEDGLKQLFNPSGTTAGVNVGIVGGGEGSPVGDPSSPVNGDVWYNQATAKFRGMENGAAVNLVGSGAGDDLGDHIADMDIDMQTFAINFTDAGQSIDSDTGGIQLLLPTSDDFDILINSVSEFIFTAATLDMQSNSISDLADPTNAQDAATKNYHDTTVADPKIAVLTAGGATLQAASTAAKTTIDGTNMDYIVLDFDTGSSETVIWNWELPENADASEDINVRVRFQVATGSAGVCWDGSWLGRTAGETVDSSFGTVIGACDSSTGTNSIETATLTFTSGQHGLAAGDSAFFKLSRDTADATDTNANDARLIDARVTWS